MARMRMRQSVEERIAEFIDTYVSLARAAGEPVLSRRNLTFDAALPYAPDMTIVDLRSDTEWTVCLNGTGHCERARVDRTGRNVLANCSPPERALRLAIAETMFAVPCGLRAVLNERFVDGQQARLDTTSLPLLGNDGMRKIVTYALLVEDIEEPYCERPVLRTIEVADYAFVDLGSGAPSAAIETRLIA